MVGETMLLAVPAQAFGRIRHTVRPGQGVISPRVLSVDARKLLQQRVRFGRSGARLMGPQ